MAIPLIRSAILAALALSLSGCAGMYGGIDKGLSHIGAVKRGDNLYDVVYLGNDGSTAGRRHDLTLLQSAELCRERGYDYFKASDTQAWSTYAPGARREAPKLTLQVSCYPSEDATMLTYRTDDVIDRIKTSYRID